MARRPTRVSLHSDVDLDAARCVKGHWWDFGAMRYDKSGKAVEPATCQRCNSYKETPLTWNGRRAGQPRYEWDPAYLEESRKLGDHQDRRAEFNRVGLERLRQEGLRESA